MGHLYHIFAMVRLRKTPVSHALIIIFVGVLNVVDAELNMLVSTSYCQRYQCVSCSSLDANNPQVSSAILSATQCFRCTGDQARNLDDATELMLMRAAFDKLVTSCCNWITNAGAQKRANRCRKFAGQNVPSTTTGSCIQKVYNLRGSGKAFSQCGNVNFVQPHFSGNRRSKCAGWNNFKASVELIYEELKSCATQSGQQSRRLLSSDANSTAVKAKTDDLLSLMGMESQHAEGSHELASANAAWS